ncbi:polysaccharide deacetylase family protein [Xylanivirga thermophila]|jgi:peptidoglycan-N-acetylglucosamine deacetylase|uniref:polysaccharide deacetylase family protein n=1 Tax=Xylanivirga thermophila TaxID=2496273 RepID=UPI001FB4E88E|nr:polysaccharide deacetylase family protein [Xylanivirga thermophila]
MLRIEQVRSKRRSKILITSISIILIFAAAVMLHMANNHQGIMRKNDKDTLASAEDNKLVVTSDKKDDSSDKDSQNKPESKDEVKPDNKISDDKKEGDNSKNSGEKAEQPENNSQDKDTKVEEAPIDLRQENLRGVKKWTEGDGKVAYLTFDDGPSKNTPQILDILKQQDVKATFFVIGNLAEQKPDIIKREVAEGHAIGNHTYSHDYKSIYQNPDALLQDMHKTEDVLKSILGSEYECKLFRFPGGSFGEKLKPYKDKLDELGYNYADWNALNGDAEGRNIPVETLISKVKKTTNNKNRVIILMHDAGAKKTTVQALPAIIEYLKGQGYEFKTLND